MAYISKGPTYGLFQKQTLSVNGVLTDFVLDHSVSSSSSILVVSGGVIQEPSVAYSVIESGTKISFAVAPSAPTYLVFLGKQLLMPTQAGFEVSVEQFTGTGSQTIFTLLNNPVVNSGLLVYVNGIQQSVGPGKNFILSGMNVVFSSAPALGAEIDVYILAKEKVSINVPTDGSITRAKLIPGIQNGLAQWAVVNTNTNAVLGTWYMVDTFAGARTLTLPASASLGDTFKIVDYSGTFATNNCTVARNGHLINGLSENLVIDVSSKVELIYTGTTFGWRVL